MYEFLIYGAMGVLTAATILNYISLRQSEKRCEEQRAIIIAMAERNKAKEEQKLVGQERQF